MNDFIKWYKLSLKYKDCDPAVWLTNYLNKRYEHNIEQKYWLSWLYGNTYYFPTAWIILQEYPDFELVGYERLKKWNDENYKRLRYQVDTKWNKGHLPEMFQSYQKFIGKETQFAKFQSMLQDNEYRSFDYIWDQIKGNLHKFGRYSTWFYMQHLKHTVNLPVEPYDLRLGDFSGSRSHRNGLLYAIGNTDQIDTKLSEKEIGMLEGRAREILFEVRKEYPNTDMFEMETCLCSFKKLFRKTNGRYIGYYLDRQSEEILKVSQDGWYGIDWDVLWQARQESLHAKHSGKNTINKNRYSEYLDTKQILVFPNENIEDFLI